MHGLSDGQSFSFHLVTAVGGCQLVSYLTPIELRYRIYDATMKIIAANIRFKMFLYALNRVASIIPSTLL